MPALIVSIAVVACWSRAAFAHGAAVDSSRPAWTFDPWIVVPLGLVALLYGAGLWRLRRRTRATSPIVTWKALAFAGGWLALAGALVSPLHWLGERLFTFHMIEHEIVMAVSAPLLVMARPIAPLLWGLPRSMRKATAALMQSRGAKRIWDWLTRGGNATALHGVAIWMWHVPVLFDSTLTDVSLHRLQHLSFFVTAVLFWWAVLWRSDRGVAAWHLFVTMLHTGILGALMALAPRVLYLVQTRTAEAWGLTPLEDQQLAGMMMWIPAGTVYAGTAMVMMALWIAGAGKEARHVPHLRLS